MRRKQSEDDDDDEKKKKHVSKLDAKFFSFTTFYYMVNKLNLVFLEIQQIKGKSLKHFINSTSLSLDDTFQ